MKINPETDSGNENGGASDRCGPGRKLAHAVGMRRWTASTGTPMVTVGFVVLADGAKSGDDGKVFMERFAVTQNAAFRIARWAKATGHRSEFEADRDEDWEKIMARGPVVAELKEKTYNGRTSVEVDKFTPFSGQFDPSWDSVVQNGEREFQEIQDRIQNRLNSDGGGSSSSSYSSPPPSRGGGAPSAHDDIPF